MKREHGVVGALQGKDSRETGAENVVGRWQENNGRANAVRN